MEGAGGGGRKEVQSFHKHPKNQEFLVYIHLFVHIYVHTDRCRERVIDKNNIFIFPFTRKKQVGVSHCGLAIYIKVYLKAQEELWKLKYFSSCENIIFENPSKRNQRYPSRYYNSITNLKFQQKPKDYLSKILI